jgi:hypothetical protein
MRLGAKHGLKNYIGGKRVNQALKFGSKALGLLGDLTPVAMAVAPAAAPALEAAKLASIGLGVMQKGRQMIKNRK